MYNVLYKNKNCFQSSGVESQSNKANCRKDRAQFDPV